MPQDPPPLRVCWKWQQKKTAIGPLEQQSVHVNLLSTIQELGDSLPCVVDADVKTGRTSGPVSDESEGCERATPSQNRPSSLSLSLPLSAAFIYSTSVNYIYVLGAQW